MKLENKVLALAEERIFKDNILYLSESIAKIYDEEILEIYRRFLGDVDGVCLVGFGSFGRKLMAPCSDLDFVILTSSKSVAEKENNKISSFIHHVWDIVSKAEYSVRTPEETINLALEDEKVLTYLADIRYVAGDKKVFNHLLYLVNQLKHTHSMKIFSTLVQDRSARISKYQNLVEPDVKKSPGGLEDLFFMKVLQNLVSEDILVSLKEIEQDFLRILEVRFILHILTKRNNNSLYLGLIDEILNFIKSKTGKRYGVVEFITKVISSMQKIKVYADISQNFVKRKIYPPNPSLISYLGPYISDGEFLHADIELFKKEPWRLVEIFKIAKSNNLEISPEISYYILKVRNVDLSKDVQANKIFFEIITDLGGIEKTLMRMKELGVLEIVIPEFGRVSNLYQIYPPHIYPVGTHLIKCVGEMEKILSGIKPKFVDIMPGLDEIDKNVALLSSFLHDIGKGSKKDHSEVGEVLAERIGKRLGLAGESLDRLKFIVRNHLILAHFSQRRDLHERETIEKLASSFPDHITLNTLYLVSIADALATNPNNWNQWKAHLFGEIYGKVDEEMRKGLEYVEEEHIDTNILREELSQIFPEKIVSSYISSLSDKFISFFSYDRLFRYSCLLLKAYMDGRGVATYTTRKEGVIEVIAIDKDSLSLISECAGLLFLSGFNILSLYSEGGVLGLSINVFWVQPQDKVRAQNFVRMFRTRNLEKIIEQIRKKRGSSQFGGWQFSVKKNSRDSVKVIFDNTTSQNYTIVEVYCYDRPGLLFDISCAISFMGYEISVAKISTREDKVADIFYIRDRATGKKLLDEQCEALKDAIRDAIIQGIQIQLGQRQLL